MKTKCLVSCVIALASPFMPALAADPPPIELVLNPVAPGVLATTFTRDVKGLFTDTFTFTPATFAGTVSVSLAPVSGPINFGVALLNGQGFSFDPDAGSPVFSFTATVLADQPLQLTLLGFAGDAETLGEAMALYRGTVVAVPEPGSYAMMAAGLVLLAARARRRRRETPTPA